MTCWLHIRINVNFYACVLFNASYSKLFFSGFFENSSIILLSRKQHGFMSTEQLETLSKIRHTSDPNLSPTVILFELMIFPFMFFVVWVTFPHFHPITYLSEILVLQNWSLTRVLSQTVCIHLGYDISM